MAHTHPVHYGTTCAINLQAGLQADHADTLCSYAPAHNSRRNACNPHKQAETQSAPGFFKTVTPSSPPAWGPDFWPSTCCLCCRLNRSWQQKRKLSRKRRRQLRKSRTRKSQRRSQQRKRALPAKKMNCNIQVILDCMLQISGGDTVIGCRYAGVVLCANPYQPCCGLPYVYSPVAVSCIHNQHLMSLLLACKRDRPMWLFLFHCLWVGQPQASAC